NTNGGNFELFAAVADADGCGIPLGFLFLLTTKDAAAGAKQKVLTRFLGGLKELGVQPEFTLTDKDWSEINAMAATWPDAKPQLCIWHALRAQKKRLCKNKDTPAPYDVHAARREFEFIDVNFVPISQQDPFHDPIPPPPEKPVPRVRLLVNGRPPVLTQSLPKIVLTPTAIACALAPKPPSKPSDDALPDELFDIEAASGSTCHPPIGDSDRFTRNLEDDELSDDGTFWGDHAQRAAAEDGLWEYDEWEGFKDIDDMRRDLEAVAEDTTNVSDDRADPSETGPRTASATYQFCPPAHRLPILRLFAKHASQHSLLPERHGESRTAEEIYRDAVSEMYRHCKTNNLTEVWAYLWNSWYCRARWRLWARSAYPDSIPCKRTTMIVEALWRGIKCLVLYMYNRPPVDLALYAIVTRALPPYRHMLSKILNDPRKGRAKSLSHTQTALKRAWKRLLKSPINGEYSTDVAQWTCDCGAQKYHAHLLCKHLVQAVGKLPESWWPTAVRYHILPFYTVPIRGKTARAPEKLRDHAWLPRLARQPQAFQVRHQAPCEDESDIEIPPLNGHRPSSPISSSPDKAPPTGSDGLMWTRAGGGGGFDLDDEEELEVEEAVRLLEYAKKTLDEQRDSPEVRFLENAKQCMRTTVRWVQDTLLIAGRPSTIKTSTEAKDWSVDDLIAILGQAVVHIRESQPGSSSDKPQYLRHALQRIQGTIAWARDVEYHAERRRTIPQTNRRKRGEPDPTNVLGYRYGSPR
ncbi:hypothetical protein GY45DRAFT_1262496, partial [Cubamyces sp. BRFM 1775]